MGYQYVRFAQCSHCVYARQRVADGELPPHAIAIKGGKIAALLPCDDSLDDVFEQAKSVIDVTIPQK